MRNIILLIIIISALFFTYKMTYNHIYTKGYNEAVKITQEQLDKKYNDAVENIKKENKEQADIENKKNEDSKKTRDLLQKQYNETNKKLNELLKDSKSNLINKECKAEKKEIDFFNNN